MNDEWRPSIAVLGAGAVGCYFGGMLARSGAIVTLIGRQQHVDAINADGLLVETAQFRENVPVAASTDVSAAEGSDLVLFCVKAQDTERAARSLAPYLTRESVVVSLQNGVDNAHRIYLEINNPVVSAVVYVAVEMIASGHVKHSARGDLILGLVADGNDVRLSRDRIAAVASVFGRAGVPCKVSENIEGELWTKLVMNCAYNAISALGRARYGAIVQTPAAREVMRRVVEETMAVAAAAGVRLPSSGMFEDVLALGEAMSRAMSSTAQDISLGKPTEIDSLNGYVARRGAELGVDTPVNSALGALVKLLEEERGRAPC